MYDEKLAHWDDIEAIRGDFPLLANAHVDYLDNSATSQKPQCVIDKEKDYYEHYNANPFRGLYEISVKATDEYEEARATVAGFINAAEKEEVIFTRNASESLNLVAYSLGDLLVGPDDEIISSVVEHHSNLLPWKALAERKGAKVVYAMPEADGKFDPEKIRDLLTPKTKIVALSAMSNIFGSVNDMKTIAKIVHENGSVLVVDGAQSVPHVKTDVQDMDCDFLAFSGHKMLGPMGIGVLYGKRKWLEAMPPFMMGGEMIDSVTLDKTVYAPVPHKFEAGTVNAAGAIAFAEAIRYLQGIGLDRIEAREEMLTQRLVGGMLEIPHVVVIGSQDPADHHGICAFKIEGVHPHDVSTILDADNIAVRAGHHCAQPLHNYLCIPSTTRASLMFYNTEDEIDRFLASVRTIRPKMGYQD
jgi:cysteine desulfurase/selenocysteine lyase